MISSCDVPALTDKMQQSQANVRALFGLRYDHALGPCRKTVAARMESQGETPLVAAVTIARTPGLSPLFSAFYMAAGMDLMEGSPAIKNKENV